MSDFIFFNFSFVLLKIKYIVSTHTHTIATFYYFSLKSPLDSLVISLDSDSNNSANLRL